MSQRMLKRIEVWRRLMLGRLLVACVLACWVGCGKQPAASPSATEPTPARAAPSPTILRPEPAAAAAATAPADPTQTAALLRELTQAVRKYSVEQRRAPKGLEELSAQGYLRQVPAAPSGKKFVITKNLQVELVNR
jgi:hypothetical protein